MSDTIQLHKPTLLFCAALLDGMCNRALMSGKLTALRREVVAGAFGEAAAEIEALALDDGPAPPDAPSPAPKSPPSAPSAPASAAAVHEAA